MFIICMYVCMYVFGTLVRPMHHLTAIEGLMKLRCWDSDAAQIMAAAAIDDGH